MVFDPVAKRVPSSHKKFTLHLTRTAPFAAAANFENSLEMNGISAAPLTPTDGGTHKCKAVCQKERQRFRKRQSQKERPRQRGRQEARPQRRTRRKGPEAKKKKTGGLPLSRTTGSVKFLAEMNFKVV